MPFFIWFHFFFALSSFHHQNTDGLPFTFVLIKVLLAPWSALNPTSTLPSPSPFWQNVFFFSFFFLLHIMCFVKKNKKNNPAEPWTRQPLSLLPEDPSSRQLSSWKQLIRPNWSLCSRTSEWSLVSTRLRTASLLSLKVLNTFLLPAVALPYLHRTGVSTFCWTSEPDVSSSQSVLVQSSRSRRWHKTWKQINILRILRIFCRVLKTLTLTARFTNLPLVAGAAAEGRLEVVDGLLKDLPFPALAEVNN